MGGAINSFIAGARCVSHKRFSDLGGIDDVLNVRKRRCVQERWDITHTYRCIFFFGIYAHTHCIVHMQDVRQLIAWPLAHPEVYRHLGVDPPKYVLGLGKHSTTGWTSHTRTHAHTYIKTLVCSLLYKFCLTRSYLRWMRLGVSYCTAPPDAVKHVSRMLLRANWTWRFSKYTCCFNTLFRYMYI